MRTIFSDINRSILSRAFLIAALLGAVAMWVGSINDLLNYYNMNKTMQMLFQNLGDLLTVSALKSDAMLLFVPIIAAIPFTTAFVDDIKSGFIKHFLTRSTFCSYIIGK